MDNWEKRKFQVPDEILNLISIALKSYKGGGKQLGLVTAQNIIKTREVTGHLLKKFANIFKGNNEVAKQLLGGQDMSNWVDLEMKNMRDANETRKDLKDTAGISNSHRKTHVKESLIVFVPIIKKEI